MEQKGKTFPSHYVSTVQLYLLRRCSDLHLTVNIYWEFLVSPKGVGIVTHPSAINTSLH
jgi:hypothetical protein